MSVVHGGKNHWRRWLLMVKVVVGLIEGGAGENREGGTQPRMEKEATRLWIRLQWGTVGAGSMAGTPLTPLADGEETVVEKVSFS